MTAPLLPLAFLDVDGVLNRDVSNSQARKRKLLRSYGFVAGQGHRLWLDTKDRGRLRLLSEHFELAWGTTWDHSAHDAVGRRLLPSPLEVVAVRAAGEESKGTGVVRAAAGRPFVWFDDEAEPDELVTTTAHLLIRCDPADGLTDEHVGTALAWAAALNPQ